MTTNSDPSTGDQLSKRRAETWPGRVRRSLVAFRSPARPGPARPGPARPGPARPGPARPGPARPGPARPGPARPGPARPGPARPGPGRRRERDGKDGLDDGRDHFCM